MKRKFALITLSTSYAFHIFHYEAIADVSYVRRLNSINFGKTIRNFNPKPFWGFSSLWLPRRAQVLRGKTFLRTFGSLIRKRGKNAKTYLLYLPDRVLQRNEGVLLLHRFLTLEILVVGLG